MLVPVHRQRRIRIDHRLPHFHVVIFNKGNALRLRSLLRARPRGRPACPLLA
jgi:hypothetical protein